MITTGDEMIRQELYKNMDCCGGVYPDSVMQGYQQGSVTELEKGVLTVMKTELKLIVDLGALIGLVIGSINIFI